MPRDSNHVARRVLRHQDDAVSPIRHTLDPSRFDQEADDIHQMLTDSATRAELGQLQQQVSNLNLPLISAFAYTLLDDQTSTEANATLGLGTAARKNVEFFVATDGSSQMTGPLKTPQVIADLTVTVKDTADASKLWGLAAANGKARITLNGVDYLTLSADGTSQTIRDSSGNYRQIAHAGNTPTITVNGIAPDSSGNIAISTTGGVTDGDHGDIAVSGSGATWTIKSKVVKNNNLNNAPDATVKANLSGAAASPSDVTMEQLADALMADNNAAETLRFRMERPRTPTLLTATSVRAYSTGAKGGAATLNVYQSTDGGAFVLVSSGPNTTNIVVPITAGHSYAFYSRVRFNNVNGPTSDDLYVTTGGIVDNGGRSETGGDSGSGSGSGGD